MDSVKNEVTDALRQLEMTPKQCDEMNDTHPTVQLSCTTQEELKNEQFPMPPQLILECQKVEKQTYELLNQDDNDCTKA